MNPAGRPPLPRYRATLVLDVHIGATGPADAEHRLAELVDALSPRLEASVRGHRRGTPRVLGRLRGLLTPTREEVRA